MDFPQRSIERSISMDLHGLQMVTDSSATTASLNCAMGSIVVDSDAVVCVLDRQECSEKGNLSHFS